MLSVLLRGRLTDAYLVWKCPGSRKSPSSPLVWALCCVPASGAFDGPDCAGGDLTVLVDGAVGRVVSEGPGCDLEAPVDGGLHITADLFCTML